MRVQLTYSGDSYALGAVSHHLVSLDRTWLDSLRLTASRPGLDGAEQLLRSDPRLQLQVERMRLGSPFDITLAAASTSGAVLYAMHLLVKIVRDPQRIGAWLPRLR